MNTRSSILGIFFILLHMSCKKDVIETTSLVSVNVAAAVIDGGNVKLNTNARDSARAYNFKNFNVIAGNSEIILYPTSDPSIYYFNNTLATTGGELYSIFLCGPKTAAESVVVKENYPARYTDSSFGVRVINLSPNSQSINITLAANTANNIFSKIGYKQLSDFLVVPLPTNVSTNSVTFQVRDAVSNSLLSSYTLPVTVNNLYPNVSITAARFRNLTLVIKGTKGVTTGVDAFGIYPMPNY